MASLGVVREGTGRKKMTTYKAEKCLLRIFEGLYDCRTALKNLRKARNDEEVFNYLLLSLPRFQGFVVNVFKNTIRHRNKVT